MIRSSLISTRYLRANDVVSPLKIVIVITLCSTYTRTLLELFDPAVFAKREPVRRARYVSQSNFVPSLVRAILCQRWMRFRIYATSFARTTLLDADKFRVFFPHRAIVPHRFSIFTKLPTCVSSSIARLMSIYLISFLFRVIVICAVRLIHVQRRNIGKGTAMSANNRGLIEIEWNNGCALPII